MKNTRLILFFLFAFFVDATGQNIDSLKKTIGSRNSLENAKKMYDIGNYYLRKGKPDSCIKYTEESVIYFTENENLSEAYENIGMAYYYKSDYSNSLEYFLKALKTAQAAGNDSITARRYSDLGVVYDYLGADDKATENYIKALKLLEKAHDVYGIAKIYNNLGVINEEIGNYKTALSYYEKSFDIKKNLNSETGLTASSYVNIGSVNEKLKNYNIALENYFAAFGIYSRLKNTKFQTLCLNNIAGTYLKKGNLKNAKQFSDSSKRISEQNGNKYGLLNAKLISGEIFLKENKTDSAFEAFNKAFDYAQKFKLQDKQLVVLKYLTELFKKQNDFKTAFEYQSKFLALKEKTETEKTEEKIEHLQIVYETEKKEQEIINLKNDLSTKRIVWISAVFILLMISALIFLFLKNKLNKSKLANSVFNQKLLRSQMNPHFIFNALSAVQSFMLENDAKQAAVYLSSFSKLTRSILNNSREEFVTVSEEIATVENYLKIQQLRMSDKFSYELIVDENLDTDYYMIPPMISQPFIENAVLHAFKDADYKGYIEVHFLLYKNMLKVTVRDNGMGISKNASKEHKSYSIKITGERLKLLKKQSNTDIRFEIINLKDVSDKNGTLVQFILPLIKNLAHV